MSVVASCLHLFGAAVQHLNGIPIILIIGLTLEDHTLKSAHHSCVVPGLGQGEVTRATTTTTTTTTTTIYYCDHFLLVLLI